MEVKGKVKFDNYQSQGFFDELFTNTNEPRNEAQALIERINSLPPKALKKMQHAAESAFFSLGITFNVYGDKKGKERIFPFDIIPRIIEKNTWQKIEQGLKQRTLALNLFIEDIYNQKNILKDRVIPVDLIKTASTYLPQAEGFKPPLGIWTHISGTDLIRDENGQFFILEDNLRCPSGVSYVLENRTVLKQTFPKVFKDMGIAPVEDYPERLHDSLRALCPEKEKPLVVLLTPGRFNSAYFEHAFLAQKMGIQLVESPDLIIDQHKVFLRTTKGFEQVDVIYRRIDDDFLDPEVFRKDSLLGLKGLINAYRRGNVVLANAIGAGIADDKAVYAYTPKIIKYYLGEDPLLPIVPTYLCAEKKDQCFVLDNLDKLVVKPVNASGGYGMLVGPHSTKEEQKLFLEKIRQNPRSYIAQPTMKLSRAPVIYKNGFAGRHIDLRPYILYGKDIYILPGGLTRVALKPGSLVVNSSQGGGSKDTWVISNQKQSGENHA